MNYDEDDNDIARRWLGRDDVMQLMREAGYNTNFFSTEGVDKFGHFAALVASREREACAKVADEWQTEIDDPRYQCDCAEAIRARGE
jgi:glucan phosphoethanolaminetransferase (alkaline phosphatase superfamily)